MDRNFRLRFAWIALLAWGAATCGMIAPLDCQQPVSTRLLGYGSSAWIPWPTDRMVFEIDAGSGKKLPLASVTSPASLSHVVSGGHAAVDVAGGRWFVYDISIGWSGYGSGGTLLTIDMATGAVISSVQPPCWDVRGLQYESSTGRLLGMACLTTGLVPSEIDPMTGIHTPLTSFAIPAGPAMPWNRDYTALDPVNQRMLLYRPNAATQWFNMTVIDTSNGSVVADHPVPYGIGLRNVKFDPVTGQLYGFAPSGAYIGATSGLVIVDGVTGTISPLAVGHGPEFIDIEATMPMAATLDSRRRLYHFVGAYAGGAWPFGQTSETRLFTFDLATGNMLSDPEVDGVMPYFLLAVDEHGSPQRGRVTVYPNHDLVLGGTRTVVFDWAGHGGDLYIPFVSCTPGSFSPGPATIVLPLAFDACTQFYLTSPLSPILFQLAPGGIQGALVGPAGVAFGGVGLPVWMPAGLRMDLHVGFLTLTPQWQWSGAHGYSTIHIRT